ncbi:MAG TPA: hypothetical protein VH599_14285 [Ktedonobacterales bacterium]
MMRQRYDADRISRSHAGNVLQRSHQGASAAILPYRVRACQAFRTFGFPPPIGAAPVPPPSRRPTAAPGRACALQATVTCSAAVPAATAAPGRTCALQATVTCTAAILAAQRCARANMRPPGHRTSKPASSRQDGGATSEGRARCGRGVPEEGLGGGVPPPGAVLTASLLSEQRI